MAKSKLTNVYFSHDRDTRNDDKISEMFFNFRKYAQTLNRDELISLAGISCYSIFWSILEYMHRNKFKDKDIALLADSLRIKPEFVEKILKDFKLFKHQEDEFISERLQKDIELQNEKSNKAKKAAEKSWVLENYANLYEAEFGITPVLEDEEVKTLIKFSEKVENFKEVLADILYTLKNIKFDGKMKFEPKSNWLLTKNNIVRVYHGEFGALMHRKTEDELKAEEQKKEQEKAKDREDDFKLENFTNKEQALNFLKEHITDTRFITPQHKQLMEKFKIHINDIKKRGSPSSGKPPD